MIIEILERAFTSRRPTEALRRQIIRIQAAGMTSDVLYNRLIELRNDFDLHDAVNLATPRSASDDLPRIVCSMALV